MGLRRLLVVPAIGLLLHNVANALPILTPFINELHYDNLGTDVDEFIEIAGSPQSLLGFRLLLYNGGNGTSYRSIPLDITIPDQSNGFGTVALRVNGLQNGPADGIALVDPLDQVLDWLSYEGQLLAQNGPASGLLSHGLDVLQVPSTAPGLSLQRTGAGFAPADFSWVGPVANSPGAINAGQQWLGTSMAIDEPMPMLLLGLGLILVGLRQYYCRALNCRRRAVSTGSV